MLCSTHDLCVTDFFEKIKGNRTEVVSVMPKLLHRKLGRIKKKKYGPGLFPQIFRKLV